MSDSPMDEVLSSVLRAYRLSARVFAHKRLCDDWEITMPVSTRATFHLIGVGACALELYDGAPPQALAGGDLILFPRDARHSLRSVKAAESAPACDGETVILCGYLEFDEGRRNVLLDSLPDLVRLSCVGENANDPLQAVTGLMLAEARSQEIGRQAMLDRLSEALLVLALRHYLATAETVRGFYAALHDPRLRKVLNEIHLNPGNPWKVEDFCALAGMSRSSLMQRFSDLLGESPLNYLTGVRMRSAALLLESENLSVAAVAEQMGYSDEAAFRKAFKRVLGIGPGAVRRRG